MKKIIPLTLVLFLSLGCYIGPMGFMIGAAAYEHQEIYPTDKDEEADPLEAISVWRTRIARTWGTSMIEGTANMQEERFSFGSKGISDNMRGVIGDDSLEKAIQAFVAGVSPQGGASFLLNKLAERDAERDEADDLAEGGGFLSMPSDIDLEDTP